MNTSNYRQRVDTFRKRLLTLAGEGRRRRRVDKRTGKTVEPRVYLDTTGNRSRAVPGSDNYQRLVLYGRRRYLSVCRIFLLMQWLKSAESLALPISVSPTRAYWQSFTGSRANNACHTCPALLMINGRLPTQMSSNMAWRQQVIVVFADCMLMSRAVNDIDSIIDDLAGRAVFAAVVKAFLEDASAQWEDAAREYRELMRQVYPPLHEMREVQDPRIEALQAFYEGLYLTSAFADLKQYQAQLVQSIGADWHL